MQVVSLKDDGLIKEYKMTLHANDIDVKIESATYEIVKKAKIKGFRPGKVPVDYIKKRYGQEIEQTALEELMSDQMKNFFEEKNIQPAIQPNIDPPKDWKIGQDYTYVLSTEILPVISAPSFEEMALNRYQVKPDETMIDQAIDNLLQRHTELVALTEKRAVQMDDYVDLNITAYYKGEKIEELSKESEVLVIGKDEFVTGFSEHIKNMQEGEEKKISLVMQDDKKPDWKEKEIEFVVKLQNHKIFQKPVLNDEFAQKMGVENQEKLKELIAQECQKSLNHTANILLSNQMIEFLESNLTFEIPPTLLHNEYKAKIHQKAHQKNTSKEHHECSFENDEALLEEDEKKECKQKAEKTVRMALFLSDIIKKHNIKITQDELKDELINRAQQAGVPFEYYIKLFANNKQMLEQLNAEVMEKKALNALIDQARPQEIDITNENFRKILEEKQNQH